MKVVKMEGSSRVGQPAKRDRKWQWEREGEGEKEGGRGGKEREAERNGEEGGSGEGAIAGLSYRFAYTAVDPVRKGWMEGKPLGSGGK